MAAIEQSAPLDRRAQKSMIVQIRRGLPAGPVAWTSQSRSPSAPAAFTRDPAQIALGQALAARVTEATRITAEDAASVRLFEFASGRFAKPIHDLHNLTTRAIARFLVTGQGTTETERNFIGRVGVMAAVLGLSVATLTRSYLLWRESNLRVLNEEVKRLGTSHAVYDEARRLIRSSAETGLARMVQAHQDQMDILGHHEDAATAV